MSLLVSIALVAASGTTYPSCSWDKPGVNPFTGDVVAAVDRYTDIPLATRNKLKARMNLRQYDEIVSIGRDAIVGQAQYSSEIRQMYFGSGSICNTVTRTRWTQTMQERGLVYCEDGQCILVPTVCRNVSRISRVAPRPTATAAPGAGPSQQIAAAEPQSQLDMDPTGAGVPAAAAAPGSFAQSAGRVLDEAGLGTPGNLLPGISPSVGTGPAGPSLGGSNIPFLPPVGASPPVPEPETYALMLAGLAVIGWVARRRRTT